MSACASVCVTRVHRGWAEGVGQGARGCGRESTPAPTSRAEFRGPLLSSTLTKKISTPATMQRQPATAMDR